MSADLELFATIRLPALKIESSNGNGVVIGEEDECKTPSSKENKIPAVLKCPPAPKKSKRRGVSCKRKLVSEFFEIVNREEVDAFFNAAFDESISKRSRCPACI